MKKRKTIKLINESEYAAKIEVELIESEEEWSPYLSLNDAYKLDDVRRALLRGDLETAKRYGKVFRLTPVR